MKTLITGAAGTIGSELARRVIPFNPKKLILVDHAENPLVLLEYELRALVAKQLHSNLDLAVRIADVSNKESIALLSIPSFRIGRFEFIK